MANRGGLSSPTEYTFFIATLEAKFYNAMLNGQSTVMQQFLKQRNHQQVVLLTQNIENSSEAKKKVGVVFVDLTAAYDAVWHRGLTCKLLRLLPISK